MSTGIGQLVSVPHCFTCLVVGRMHPDFRIIRRKKRCTAHGSSVIHEAERTQGLFITETNRIHLVLFGMQNRTLGLYLAAINRILSGNLGTVPGFGIQCKRKKMKFFWGLGPAVMETIHR
jgi:hypothetical protein